MPSRKRLDPIPEEFASYEEAAEFWETHDSTDYPDAFQTVKDVVVELRKRRYEIEIDEDVFAMLCQRAQDTTPSQLANKLLRQSLWAERIKSSNRVLLGLLGLNKDRTMFPHSGRHALR